MLALPPILIALVLVAILGVKLGNVVLVYAMLTWTGYARQVRGEVLSVKRKDFVSLTIIAGCSPTRILVRHILPNVAGTVLVIATLQVGMAILFESMLSFLGMGVPPPTPTWGRMVSEGRSYITSAWWLITFPGLAIASTVLSINLLGDWYADYLDPMRRSTYVTAPT
jgi:peptide/nickel transport system permease protein